MLIDKEGNLWVGFWSGGLNKISFSHSKTGINRISNIIRSLKTYSYKGEGAYIETKIKDLIDSTITLLQSKIPENIEL